MQTVEQNSDVLIRDTNNFSTKDAIENVVAQMESTGEYIAYPGKRHCNIRHEASNSECESKSEAEVVGFCRHVENSQSLSE